MYTGYKSQYNFNIITIWSPDGICLAATDPSPGYYNDASIMKEFQINKVLALLLDAAAIADGIFAAESHVVALRDGLNCNADEVLLLKSLRGSVEHGFGMLKMQFPLLDCKNKMKLGSSHPIYIVFIAIILNNMKCCMRGNEISSRFGLRSPSINEIFYLEKE